MKPVGHDPTIIFIIFVVTLFWYPSSKKANMKLF